MAASLFEKHRVIDIDTHVTEPPDVFTTRVASKWKDRVPHVTKAENGDDIWVIGDQMIGHPGAYSMAGHTDAPPNFVSGYSQIPASMMEPRARLTHMDEEKIYANVLYPNVGGFGAGGFLKLGEPELMLECVSAYNDFLFEWASEDLERLVPVMSMPFWDVAAAVGEIERCAAKGFRALVMCNQPQDFGMPFLRERHWDPVWAAAQDAGLSISFHIGGGDLSDLLEDVAGVGFSANFARASALVFLDNGKCLADVIMGGICHRFPRLKMVSVESGVGWIPFILEALDWQWKNSGVGKEHPEWDLLPSEYFRRQMYGSFWFEEGGLANAIELYPDNILYETDYPHPTCMAPGPASAGTHPGLYAEKALAGVSAENIGKVLHGSAAALYGIA
ncbi:MAG: amidohydrolase family protein [Myxococcota bacterium]|jgi:predicted TIM-barrel fold metal-dependent hydrolase|nr:amidohydrolase family protein [Myxococcota bacterium]